MSDYAERARKILPGRPGSAVSGNIHDLDSIITREQVWERTVVQFREVAEETAKITTLTEEEAFDAGQREGWRRACERCQGLIESAISEWEETFGDSGNGPSSRQHVRGILRGLRQAHGHIEAAANYEEPSDD